MSPVGDHLLNPTEVAWSEHFRLVEDEILPLPGDRNAAYTAEVFDLNDQRKVEMRRLRRLSIHRSLSFLTDSKRLEKGLLEEGKELGDRSRVELAQKLHSYVRLARQDLNRYAAIPADADTQCLCRTTRHHVLPDWLSEQTLSLREL